MKKMLFILLLVAFTSLVALEKKEVEVEKKDVKIEKIKMGGGCE